MRGLDAGRDAVERQLEIGEVAAGQRLFQHPAQRLDRVQVGAGPGQPGHLAKDRLAERLLYRVALPHLAQPCRRAVRVGGHERAGDRAHRRAHDEMGPDAGLGKGPEHADLVSAEHPAATEHERGLHRAKVTAAITEAELTPANVTSGRPGQPRMSTALTRTGRIVTTTRETPIPS